MTAPALNQQEPATWADFASAFDITSLDLARRRGTKRKALAAVDHLIALLDALDSDTEDREPSLGAPERGPCYSQVSWACGSGQDGEGEPEAGYDLPEGDDERCASGDVDREPTLGAPENHDDAPNQRRWAQGGYLGHDEPEADGFDAGKLGPSRSWATVEADRRVAEAAARQAVAMRRRKAGFVPRLVAPDTLVFVEPGVCHLPNRQPSNLRLLGPGCVRLGGPAHV